MWSILNVVNGGRRGVVNPEKKRIAAFWLRPPYTDAPQCLIVSLIFVKHCYNNWIRLVPVSFLFVQTNFWLSEWRRLSPSPSVDWAFLRVIHLKQVDFNNWIELYTLSLYNISNRCSHDVLVDTISEMEHCITKIGTEVDFCQVDFHNQPVSTSLKHGVMRVLEQYLVFPCSLRRTNKTLVNINKGILLILVRPIKISCPAHGMASMPASNPKRFVATFVSTNGFSPAEYVKYICRHTLICFHERLFCNDVEISRWRRFWQCRRPNCGQQQRRYKNILRILSFNIWEGALKKGNRDGIKTSLTPPWNIGIELNWIEYWNWIELNWIELNWIEYWNIASFEYLKGGTWG